MEEQIPLYETRSMVAMLRQEYPNTTVLRDRHFGRVETHTTPAFDLDVKKGNRNVAISVNPHREGKVVSRQGYKTRSYKPPYFREKRVFTATDLLLRDPGTSPYDEAGREGRIDQAMAQDLLDLQQRLDRAEELQCAQLVQTGKCDVYEEEGGTIKKVDELDFGMDGTHTGALQTAWTSTANAPFDLKRLLKLVADDSGLPGDVVYMGEKAAEAFINNAKTIELFEKLRINVGQIEPSGNATSAMYIASVFGAQLWEYSTLYTDPITGESKPLIDPWKVVVMSSQGDYRRHYGPIMDPARRVYAPIARFPKIYAEEDPPSLWLMLQSAFLMGLHQVDAVACFTVGAD